jgi:hypothetical protein
LPAASCVQETETKRETGKEREREKEKNTRERERVKKKGRERDTGDCGFLPMFYDFLAFAQVTPVTRN